VKFSLPLPLILDSRSSMPDAGGREMGSTFLFQKKWPSLKDTQIQFKTKGNDASMPLFKSVFLLMERLLMPKQQMSLKKRKRMTPLLLFCN
jgi:hypothetical protein